MQTGHHREANKTLELIDAQASGTETRVDVMLSETRKRDLERNNEMLEKVIRCIQFLARQNLALRGATEKLICGKAGKNAFGAFTIIVSCYQCKAFLKSITTACCNDNNDNACITWIVLIVYRSMGHCYIAL